MTKRLTSKQVLDSLEERIEAQTKAIESLIGVLSGTVKPVAEKPVVEEPKAETPKVGRKHKARMLDAWQRLANKRGEAIYGYAYRKRNGKTGLWGCSEEELADKEAMPNYLGLVEVVEPEHAS